MNSDSATRVWPPMERWPLLLGSAATARNGPALQKNTYMCKGLWAADEVYMMTTCIISRKVVGTPSRFVDINTSAFPSCSLINAKCGLGLMFLSKNAVIQLRQHGARVRALRPHCGNKTVASQGSGFSFEDVDASLGQNGDQGFVVVNFYHFVHLHDPHQEVARHNAFMQGKNIHGRIYINHQGINAQLSGPFEDAMAYANWVKADDKFSALLIQVTPASHGHAFPRLQLRYKPSLVQIDGGTASLPLTDPEMRATWLSPHEWKEQLERISSLSETTRDHTSFRDARGQGRKKKMVILDLRNGYEWDIGHFKGASRPEVDCFRNTSFGCSEDQESDPLAEVDMLQDDVLMYCTGGIRCDVYSAMLRQKGYKNLYSLHGGISNYLQKEGSANWMGNLFVFDSRMAIPPAYCQTGSQTLEVKQDALSAASCMCSVCKQNMSAACHRNCANLDCNRLYISCSNCLERQKGCCSMECMKAPRLRPVLELSHRYERWHKYRSLVKNGEGIEPITV